MKVTVQSQTLGPTKPGSTTGDKGSRKKQASQHKDKSKQKPQQLKPKRGRTSAVGGMLGRKKKPIDESVLEKPTGMDSLGFDDGESPELSPHGAATDVTSPLGSVINEAVTSGEVEPPDIQKLAEELGIDPNTVYDDVVPDTQPDFDPQPETELVSDSTTIGIDDAGNDIKELNGDDHCGSDEDEENEEWLEEVQPKRFNFKSKSRKWHESVMEKAEAKSGKKRGAQKGKFKVKTEKTEKAEKLKRSEKPKKVRREKPPRKTRARDESVGSESVVVRGPGASALVLMVLFSLLVAAVGYLVSTFMT